MRRKNNKGVYYLLLIIFSYTLISYSISSKSAAQTDVNIAQSSAPQRIMKGDKPPPEKIFLDSNMAKEEADEKYKLNEDDYIYDPKGKRDPFFSKLLIEEKNEPQAIRKAGLQKYELSELNLVGIIGDSSERRGVVETPEGKSFIIKTGQLIGKKDGIIKDITDKEIVIQEIAYDYLGNRIEKISTLKLQYLEKELEE